MHKRNFRAESATADLLMAAERHLPGREAEEHDSVGLQEFFQTKEKGRLVLRLDVLYDIVDQHDVEAVFPRRHIQKIPADELSRHIHFAEIFLGMLYLVGGQVNARDGASRFG